MANSKSNIYPIQLQGAELNLNKLDAEIKQYSGFNKNNSPFVGGCLSNIFTKDEVITGANGENVYIDDNGDVWELKTDGLYKNNEKKIDTPSSKYQGNYEIKEVSFPEDTIYIYSEKFYITQSGLFYEHSDTGIKCFIIHYYNTFLNKMVSIPMEFNISYGYILKATFDVIKCPLEDSYYILACNIIYQGVNQTIKCRYEVVEVYFYSPSPRLSIVDWTTDNEWQVNESNIDDIYFPEPCLYSHYQYNSKIYFFPNICNTQSVYYYYDVISDIAQKVNVPSLLSEKLIVYRDDKLTVSSSNTQLVGVGVPSPSFYYDSGVNLSRQIQIQTSGANIYKIGYGNSIDLIPVPISYDSTTITMSSPSNSILKSWGKLISYKAANGAWVVGCCDFQTGAITSDLKFNTGGVINNCVLVNNGIVTGITLPGGTILVTEWNSVDIKFIFFSKEEDGDKTYLYYKNINNNKWYKIVKSGNLILRKIEDWLVINNNQANNAINIYNNIISTFAPAWNNRFDFGLKTYGRDTGSTLYAASSINEYKLENIPSIILNPLPVVDFTIGLEVWTDISSFQRLANKDSYIINFYYGNNATEIKYRFSENVYDRTIPFFINENLIDLNFPSNTDGNVPLTPSLFSKFFSSLGNDIFVKEGTNTYQLSKSNNQPIMSYYLGTLIEGLEEVFILQGQYYGVINKQIFAIQFNNGVVASLTSIVSVKNLQFVGNTPYEALFFSKTNRCLYSFTGANVLNQKQLVDKISEVRNYLYNPATQTVFLITDIGVLFYGLFGMFLLEYTNITNIFLLDNGIVMSDNSGNYRYIKYYLDEGDTDYTKENIRLETCFYGMNNEVVTINDCLYFRLFSEEHEEGNLKVKATTISLKGRQTEETTFKIKASDWDKITHTIYLRYQPKTQRGLGVSFSIDSPFKIASMSVGSQPDAVLVDRVSKGAITAPSVTTNNNEW